jgi:chromosome segregation ATPase
MYKWWSALVVVGLLALPVGAVQAQADNNARERELLRRAQAALRDVTAERDNLRAERASLAAQLTQSKADAESAGRTANALRPQVQRAEAGREALQAELTALREQHAAAMAELQSGRQARERELQQQVQRLRQERDERTLANQRVSALLADARRRLQELHTLSRTFIDRWRHKTPAETLAHTETLIGIAGVRAEDQAEQWRSEVDALLQPSPGP